MNRIGVFTGKIYKNNTLPEVGECCVQVSDEKLADENYINQLKAKNKLRCAGCYGCPASRKEI